MKKIIAAVRDLNEFEAALFSDVEMIFLLKSDIMELESFIVKAHKHEKKLFVHMDFADGIGKDSSGCLFLKSLGADGVISTRTNILKAAHDKGMSTVQRVFIVDSHSIHTAVDTIDKTSPDMVELMPGIATKAIMFFRDKVSVPIIVGGLIETQDEVELALSAGATAISTGKTDLWK